MPRAIQRKAAVALGGVRRPLRRVFDALEEQPQALRDVDPHAADPLACMPQKDADPHRMQAARCGVRLDVEAQLMPLPGQAHHVAQAGHGVLLQVQRMVA